MAGSYNPNNNPNEVLTDHSQPERFDYRPYLGPRYWPGWLGVGLLYLSTRLPYSVQMAVGRGLGRLTHTLLPSRRRVADINLRLAFPELDDVSRATMVKQVFEQVGTGLMEMASCWYRPASSLTPYFRIEGLEHLSKAQQRGKGVIILQPHFTLLDIAGVIISPHVKVSAVVDRPRNEMFGSLLKYQRERYVTEAIENHNIRQMVKRLKRNEAVWYSPDLFVHAEHGGIPTRYFGQPVMTTAGIARIHRLTGATILPFVPTRTSPRGHATLRFHAPLEDFDASNLTDATQRINDLFEAQVREHPEQYFWVHKRFKPVTADQADPYRA